MQKWELASDVKARARPGYRGLGPAFKSSGLTKGQAQALGQIYVEPGLAWAWAAGSSLKSQDNIQVIAIKKKLHYTSLSDSQISLHHHNLI
jgi:hypothetical protein